MLSAGCATIVAHGPDLVPVNSNPEGAQVSVDGSVVGTTPTIVALRRKGHGFLVIELAGYQTAIVDVDKSLNPWVFGNILLAGPGLVIGLPVDLITGNQGRYPTEPILVELEPEPPR
jgi:hypothetical protein